MSDALKPGDKVSYKGREHTVMSFPRTNEAKEKPMTTLVTMHTGELQALIAERDALRKQVTELQVEGTKRLDNSLYRMVRRFHEKFGHPVRHTPAVPTAEEMRFRLSLIAEEFMELLDACGVEVSALAAGIRLHIAGASAPADLAEAYDALLDLAYVIEGTHSVMGTRAEPGFAEVQRANMSKDPVYVRVKDSTHSPHIGAGGGDDYSEVPDAKAKPKKPEGWVPPDIEGVLRAQGWEP